MFSILNIFKSSKTSEAKKRIWTVGEWCRIPIGSGENATFADATITKISKSGKTATCDLLWLPVTKTLRVPVSKIEPPLSNAGLSLFDIWSREQDAYVKSQITWTLRSIHTDDDDDDDDDDDEETEEAEEVFENGATLSTMREQQNRSSRMSRNSSRRASTLYESANEEEDPDPALIINVPPKPNPAGENSQNLNIKDNNQITEKRTSKIRDLIGLGINTAGRLLRGDFAHVVQDFVIYMAFPRHS